MNTKDKCKITLIVDRELWAKVKYVATVLRIPTSKLVEHVLLKLVSSNIDEIRKELEQTTKIEGREVASCG